VLHTALLDPPDGVARPKSPNRFEGDFLYLDPCFNREEPSRSVGLRWLISRRDKEDLYSPHRNPEAWECAGARPSASGLFFGFCFCVTFLKSPRDEYTPPRVLYLFVTPKLLKWAAPVTL
jgi:hypothetical protein